MKTVQNRNGLRTLSHSRIPSVTPRGVGLAALAVGISNATFSIKGQEFMASDSNVKQAFTFTPSISMFVTCDSEGEIDHVFDKLSQGGEILMPLDAYPFSRKFGWINDEFGVSWQLSLPQ